MTPIPDIDLTGVEPSLETAMQFFPPTDIGPLWQTDSDGNFLLPEHTIGYEILGWTYEWLCNPDGGAWIFTDEQARLILWFYAVGAPGTADDGEFIYRQAVYQALKGAGKDPVAAVLSIVALIGPCLFSHWDDEGNPVAKDDKSAWVQIAAVAKGQTKNTMKLIPSLLPERTRKAFGNVDVQKEVVYAYGGTRFLEVISSASRTLEGNRPTFLVCNETQHWIPSQGGIDLYETATYNVLKTPTGRFICITNAYEPGEDSAAQRVREGQEKVWAGLEEDSGWLYCSREAHPDSPLTKEWAPFILELIRGDAVWLNIKNIVKSMADSAYSVNRIRRMFYNQITAASDSVFSPSEWSAAQGLQMWGDKRDLEEGDEVTLGFDGGKTDDATALVALRLRDKLLVPLAIWQKPDGPSGEGWRINDLEVDSEVHLAFQSYTVKAFYADVNLWESYIANWSDQYREELVIKASANSTVGFDMRGNQQKIARMFEAFMQSVLDKKLFHNGDKLLRVHVLNAKRRRNRFGLTFAKENAESPRKVDGLAAALLAFIAERDLAESGKNKAPRAPGTFYQW